MFVDQLIKLHDARCSTLVRAHADLSYGRAPALHISLKSLENLIFNNPFAGKLQRVSDDIAG
jgi:hypothetical protein